MKFHRYWPGPEKNFRHPSNPWLPVARSEFQAKCLFSTTSLV